MAFIIENETLNLSTIIPEAAPNAVSLPTSKHLCYAHDGRHLKFDLPQKSEHMAIV